jgi:hypothetical protein
MSYGLRPWADKNVKYKIYDNLFKIIFTLFKI